MTVWYACVLAGALGLFGVMLWLALRQQLLSALNQDLTDSAARFHSYFLRESGRERGEHLRNELNEFCEGLPASTSVELTGTRGLEFRYPDRGPVPTEGVRVMEENFSSAGQDFHLRVGSSTASISRTLDLLRLLLIGLIPIVIVVACLGGGWLSGKALRPVDEITSSARTIGIENLSQRLPVPATRDEIQRLTEGWNEMLARLEAAVKTLSQFAADASHELRTPLAVIRTNAEIALRRARSPESYRESLAEIEAEAARMTELVEDLLFLARHGSDPASMPMQPVDLRQLLEGLVNELREFAESREISLRASLGGAAIPVSGNAPALRRMVLALMDNALKYSSAGGEVRIELHSARNHVMLTVADHGVGIASEDLPHIFKRFYRADAARSGTGYGLGLSLAKAIAEIHGATISAESTRDKGTVFTVDLPSREARVAA